MKKEKLKKNTTISILITLLSFIAILVCIICDLAVSRKFTWSKITTSSIILAYLLLIPLIKSGKKGVSISLTMLTILILPYLYILSILLKESAVFKIGFPMSIIAITYFWCIFWIFKLLQKRIIKATGVILLLSIPFHLIVNIILSKMISEPIIDIWDILSILIMIIVSGILFMYDFLKNKKQKNLQK